MSLEQKIEELSMAVSVLTNVIANHPSNFTTAGANINIVSDVDLSETNEKPEGVPRKDKKVAEKINKESKEKALEKHAEKSELSVEELKSACLKAARSADGAKVKVKALLAKYDATVVKDVAPADRQAIFDLLESGEF